MLFKGDYKDYLNYDGFKTHVIGTQQRFAIFPKRCHLSKKIIMLENAYVQTAMWTGPGDPVFEHRWYDTNEFLIAKIKGEV